MIASAHFKQERMNFVKGIVSVMAITLAFAIIIPLVLTSAYFENGEVNYAPILPSVDGQTIKNDEIGATIAEKTEDVEEPEEELEEDELIFNFEENDSFALSPFFSIIAGNTILNSRPQEEEKEDETIIGSSPEKDPESDKEHQKPEKLPETDIDYNEDLALKEDEVCLKVYMHKTNTYEYMSLTEYLYGVVAAEMPAYFEIEALKAQAIACRSITMSKMLTGNYHNSRHGSKGAHICTFSGHCQSFTSYDEAVTKWGKAYADSIFDKIRPAVDETKGMVMVYDSLPVDAAYHSMSYKYTDDVSNVWPSAYNAPYLKSVYSPEGDDFDGVSYTDAYSLSEFKRCVRNESSKVSFGEDPSKWVTKLTRNESGRVQTVVIGGIEFSGRDIQSALGLDSANYKIEYDEDEDEFKVTVWGRGHGVGMSQYGANLFAQQGYTCTQILLHYYTGVKISSYAVPDVL